MPLDTRNPGNGDDWLSGSGEFDWGDEPSGRPPVGTQTAAGRTADEPLWPSTPGDHPDEATIRRRRAIGLIGALVVVGAIIVFAVVALGGGENGNTTSTLTATTTEQPATTPTTPQTSTTPTTTTTTTPTTPATGTLTLPGGESLELGSTGAAVTALQEALLELGYQPGGADGDYGATTAAAVGQFQRDNGLPDDGVAGPATIEAMNAALAAQASG